MRTDYQCREYKRVSIQDNCTYLKLVFQKNINNIYNPFNQVALINLQCFGYVFTENNLNEIFQNKINKYNHNIYNNPEEYDNLLKKENFDKYIPVAEISDDKFHIRCSSKLQDLNKNLEKAKYYTDYEKGKKIKEFIDQVRIIGYKVEHLTKLKRIAIDKEDYPKAKEIKIEIDKILGYIDEIDPSYYRLPTPPPKIMPPDDQMEHVRPSPEPTLNEDIKNYREIEEMPRKKIQYEVGEEKKVETVLDSSEKKSKENLLEKRGFHNIEEPSSSKDQQPQEPLEDKTFSEEDSIREELRYRLK